MEMFDVLNLAVGNLEGMAAAAESAAAKLSTPITMEELEGAQGRSSVAPAPSPPDEGERVW
ncbi:MAG: hypothetical protein AAF360_00025 [Pseudomonadota bacterium]